VSTPPLGSVFHLESPRWQPRGKRRPGCKGGEKRAERRKPAATAYWSRAGRCKLDRDARVKHAEGPVALLP